MKPVILILVAYYLPGYKAGGPIRTIANLVEHLHEEFDFKIITSDRDSGDSDPYPNIKTNVWNVVGGAQVMYCSPDRRSLKDLRVLIRRTPHDLLYLNSYFNPTYTLKPLLLRKLRMIPSMNLLIAPRGEFSKSALSINSKRKRLYKGLASLLGLYKAAKWQASSKKELEDIKTALSPNIDIGIAADMPPGKRKRDEGAPVAPHIQNGPLRLVFLSRISPMKNLDFAIRVLHRVRSPVCFNIYGPIADRNYWSECLRLIDALPKHIRVRYMGPVEHGQVSTIMAGHDLFFLPTRGENYGHVIPEALGSGTPVLVANTTPWLNLADAGVGWDLSLSDEQLFVDRIDGLYEMGLDERRKLRENALRYADAELYGSETISANRLLLRMNSGNSS